MIARFSHDNGVSFGEEVVLRDDYGTTERMPDLGYPRARHPLSLSNSLDSFAQDRVLGRACGEGRRHVRLLLEPMRRADQAHRY